MDLRAREPIARVMPGRWAFCVAWVRTLRARGRLRPEIVKRRDEAEGFVVQPRRWAVERTLARLGRCRHPSEDDEVTIPGSETRIKLATIHLMVRRPVKKL